jgi:hypothetical protein
VPVATARRRDVGGHTMSAMPIDSTLTEEEKLVLRALETAQHTPPQLSELTGLQEPAVSRLLSELRSRVPALVHPDDELSGGQEVWRLTPDGLEAIGAF